MYSICGCLKILFVYKGTDKQQNINYCRSEQIKLDLTSLGSLSLEEISKIDKYRFNLFRTYNRLSELTQEGAKLYKLCLFFRQVWTKTTSPHYQTRLSVQKLLLAESELTIWICKVDQYVAKNLIFRRFQA